MNNQEESGKSMLPRTKNLLSVQSHVAHGYVGNKTATFPLQYRGWNVDVLNTVQYSNHPGYGFFGGFESKSSDLHDIIKKGLIGELEINYDAILTGYISDIEGLKDIGILVQEFCERNLQLKWILDPVLGDNGKLYVTEGNAEVYKDILKKSKIYLTTPNQFEMELLTGISIADLSSLKESFVKFHALYPNVENIVLTSVDMKESNLTLISACCHIDSNSDNRLKVCVMEVPKIPALFNGSGDLFSALLTDELLTEQPEPSPLKARDGHETLKDALNNVLILTDSILKKTYELSLSDISIPAEGAIKIKDLKLIQCRDLLDKSYVSPLQNLITPIYL